MGEISLIPPLLRSKRRIRDIRRILVIQRCVFLIEGKEEKRRGRKRKKKKKNGCLELIFHGRF
jgi:hypothetical protein